MGKGRAPCCDKSQVKRGPWSPAEDLRLITYIQKHGHENWRALPKQAGLLRCGKSCRLRWINYLRPDVKRGNFTKEEEDSIIKLHESFGNKWSKIASHLPGRTDNEIKNVWNTHLKKRLIAPDKIDGDKNRDNNIIIELKQESSLTSSSSSSSASSSTMSCAKSNINNGVLDQIKSDQEISAMQDSQGEPIFNLKEISTSSISSNNSNVTNSSSQADVSMPAGNHPLGSVFDFGGFYGVNSTLEEVNKPETPTNNNKIEIPFETDFDFWNMPEFDYLGPIEQDINGAQQLHEVKPWQGPNVTEENIREIDNRKWLNYLETELGLETTPDANFNNQEYAIKHDIETESLVPKNNELLLTHGLGDPSLIYFQSWNMP